MPTHTWLAWGGLALAIGCGPVVPAEGDGSTGLLPPVCQTAGTPELRLGIWQDDAFAGEVDEIKVGIGAVGYPHLPLGLQIQFVDPKDSTLLLRTEVDEYETSDAEYHFGAGCNEESGAWETQGLAHFGTGPENFFDVLPGKVVHVTAIVTTADGSEVTGEADWLLLDPY